jgi:HEAT repeat protein
VVDTAAVARLLVALRDGSKHERQLAARELGRLGDTAAIPALIRALADTSAHVVVEAAWGLGRLYSSSAERPLLDATRAQDKNVVQAAVCSLGRVGTSDALPRLQRLRSDPNVFVASAASWAIEQIRAMPVLH